MSYIDHVYQLLNVKSQFYLLIGNMAEIILNMRGGMKVNDIAKVLNCPYRFTKESILELIQWYGIGSVRKREPIVFFQKINSKITIEEFSVITRPMQIYREME